MMTRVKYFLLGLLIMAVPAVSLTLAIMGDGGKAWNFAYFSCVMLAALFTVSIFAEVSSQSKLENFTGPERASLMEKLKKDFDRQNLISFKGRGLIFGLIVTALVGGLVYCGALVLAAIFTVTYLISCAMTSKTRADYLAALERRGGATRTGNPVSASDEEKSSAHAIDRLATRVASTEAMLNSMSAQHASSFGRS